MDRQEINAIKTRLDLANIQLEQTVLQAASHLKVNRSGIPSKLQLDTSGKPSLQWNCDTIWRGPSPENCLAEFIRLSNASDEQIFQFAKKWGVLGIYADHCIYTWHFDLAEHVAKRIEDMERLEQIFKKIDLKPTDQPLLDKITESLAYLRSCKDCAPKGIIMQERTEGYYESTDVYRTYARQFRAILCISADIHNSVEAKREEWSAAFRYSKPEIFAWKETDLLQSSTEFKDNRPLAPHIDMQREMIGGIVTALFYETDIFPCLVWNTDQPEVRFRGTEDAFGWHTLNTYDYLRGGGHFEREFRTKPGNLFPTLVLQLAAVLVTAQGVYRCDICGEPATVIDRRPRADRQRFCSDNCREEANRRKMREYQRKKRQQNKSTT